MQLKPAPEGGVVSGVSTEEDSQAATSDGGYIQQRVTKHSRYLGGVPGGSRRRDLPL